MSISDNWYTFFGLPNVHLIGGYGLTSFSIRSSAAFTNVYNKAGAMLTSVAYSGSATIAQGAIVHELAHQLDYIWGFISYNAPWTNLQPADYAYMNTFPCSTVFVAASDYCVNNPGLSNSAIFLLEFPMFVDASYPPSDPHGGDAELFAAKFENVERGAGPAYPYGVDPYLENPLSFLPGMATYISGLIANPPAAVN